MPEPVPGAAATTQPSLLARVVAQFEQFRASVYPDQAGHPTIGFGHLLKLEESFPGPITFDAALSLLEADLRSARRQVDALFRDVTLALHERDALASWVFNVGGGAAEASQLRRNVLAGAKMEAANQFLRWVHVTDPKTGAKLVSGGLVKRRDVEACWFLGAPAATVLRLAGVRTS